MRLEPLAARLTNTAGSPRKKRLCETRPFRTAGWYAERALERVRGPGVPVYEREWDLLVVVDACRLDLMREVADAGRYDFLAGGVDSVRSVESMTRHWMRESFTEPYRGEMERTAYVCGNPLSGQELDADSFAALAEPWRDAWDTEELWTLPARPVTDAAVRLAHGDTAFDRLLVHYLQPHCPFVTKPGLTQGKRPDSFTGQSWDDVWMRLEKGELDPAVVREGYRENLEYVLEEVGVLLDNVNADRAVITSDHGNAMGEWNVYGHPPHREFAPLREVPWVETTARDRGTREPAMEPAGDGDLSVEERLADLGYAD